MLNRKVKELVKERLDEEFGIKLSKKFHINELFWKEVKKERGEVEGVNVRIKRDNGVHEVKRK